MKKVISILFVVAIASANMMAQESQEKNSPKKSPEERAENMTKRMTKELALTQDQQIKMKALMVKREREREKAMDVRKGERDKMDGEIKTILTPEQFQKFQERREEMKKKQHGKRMPPTNTNEAVPAPPSAPENK